MVRRSPDTVIIFGAFSYYSQSKSRDIGDILKAGFHLVRSIRGLAHFDGCKIHFPILINDLALSTPINIRTPIKVALHFPRWPYKTV